MIKNYAIVDKELLGKGKATRAIRLLIIYIVLTRNLLLKLMLFLLSYIIPKSGKILFFSSVGNYNFPIWKNERDFQFKESPKYLAIYCSKKLRNITPIFHIPNKELFAKVKRNGIKPTKGITAFWYMLRAKYIFVESNNFFNPNASFLVGNFKIIQCWHGTPLRNIETQKKNSFKEKVNEKLKQIESGKYECVISTCKYASEILSRFFLGTKVLELGYPKNDAFFSSEFFEVENIARLFELDKFARVLLYAPTFRKLDKGVNPFDSEFLERINEALKKENYLLLVKQHPFAKSTEFNKKYSNITDVSNKVGDIQGLLMNIDVLITDYSSIIFDFALTEKLQLFYPFDIEEYERNVGGFYVKYSEENLPGLIIKGKEDFIRKIERLDVLIKDKNIKNRIKEFKNKFNRYTDGNSCKRIFQYLGLTKEQI